DDLGALLALRLGLLRHRPLDVDGEMQLVDVDERDLDAPRLRVLVDDPLERDVQLLALREELVQRRLAEHAPQRRLRELRGRVEVVLDLDDRLVRLDHAEVHDRVDLYRDVVLGDDVLRRDVVNDRTQRDPDHRLDRPEDQHEAGTLGPGRKAAEPEGHRALVLLQDVDPLEDEEKQDEDREGAPGKGKDLLHHTLRSTRSFKPSTPTTRTLSPAAAPGAPYASQYSPSRRTVPGSSESGSARTTLALRPTRLTDPVRTGARRIAMVRKVRKSRTASVMATAGRTIPRSTR